MWLVGNACILPPVRVHDRAATGTGAAVPKGGVSSPSWTGFSPESIGTGTSDTTNPWRNAATSELWVAELSRDVDASDGRGI